MSAMPMSNGTSSCASVPAPASSLLSDRSWLAGVFIGTVAFGIQIPLFILALKRIWQRRLNTLFLTMYTASLFTLNGVGCTAQLVTVQLALIDNHDFVGGAVAYVAQSQNVFVNILGNVLVIVSVWYQDGLLIHLTWWIIKSKEELCGQKRQPRLRLYLLLPFLAEIGLGCKIIEALTSAGTNLSTPLTSHLLIAYFSLSLTINIGLSINTATRCLHDWYSIHTWPGDPTRPLFLSVALTLLSGSLLYSCSAIIFLAAHGSDAPVPNLILPTVSLLQSSIPLINIICAGRSADNDNADNIKAPNAKGGKTDVETGIDLDIVVPEVAHHDALPHASQSQRTLVTPDLLVSHSEEDPVLHSEAGAECAREPINDSELSATTESSASSMPPVVSDC